jgi:DNA-binding HxlR family transcriptional regulator
MAKISSKIDFVWRSVCPIATCLDAIGDKWSLLIVRDLFRYETRTFSELREAAERISSNVLADRCRLLLSLGIIEREDSEAHARNNAFRLTPAGLALYPAIAELTIWSQTYLKQYNPEMISIT